MIDWISSWAGGIVVAVIIGTIIEMILPEGNSKKYIKVVIGVYVLFTIVSPVITKFMGKSIAVSNILNLDEYVEEAEKSAEIQNTIHDSNENNILNIYADEIKNDIVAKIKLKGYEVDNIEVDIANDKSYSILSINVDVSEIDVDKETNNGQTRDRINETNNEEENDTTNKVDSSNTIQSEVEAVENVNEIEINIGKSERNDIDRGSERQ